ncbi:oxidoreductase [Mycobacterium sp. 852002-53434_SCH5985345]|uniref:NAD-dependent epimerase/dehydratase family protein n=1 Tax=unclassified Mycobacterium TaxID=2642494 RepID=UPI0007FCCDA6|nr:MULTISPECIES: NAD(P)-dependent oxidoreductase [unclassified Mycobacterium]OBF58926.1 oxidoreductase [Mycobacterium sp. 852002-53434_SCH5985345]OBF78359.1 oxidoreductase [Mycobacterium sp. 852002-51613_SCH5001154]OBF97594.1 oxidoreductase [Mycobacterium sp. 852014-52450_SCH5900713]
MTASTVLVTGAFGQVGKRCTQILLDRGRTVVAMDLRNDNTVAVEKELVVGRHPGTLIPAYTDLLDAEAVRDLVASHRPEAVVHLAAIVSPLSYRRPALARKVNVGGTENLLAACSALPRPPLFLMASSAAVYGSRNPYRQPERITPDTPVNPIDQYGQDKVLAEAAIRASGLPYALFRLGGVISPDTHTTVNGDSLLLMRSMPGDNRMHAVDARDVALAFANGVDREATIAGKVILIGGNESYVLTQRELEDGLMEAVGLGGLGPSASLPGDPADDRGWSFTGWYDTTEAQALLDFQEHDWSETLGWIAGTQGRTRTMVRLLSPILRPVLRTVLMVQRRLEGRGPYADPWALIEKHYGAAALASAD